MKDVRLYISVASVRDWKPQFGASISGLLCHLLTHKLGGRLAAFDFKPMMQASNLSEARERGLQSAIDGGFTHWLCLDDDMVFPVNVVEHLLNANVDVIACNYRRKAMAIKGVCCDEESRSIDSTPKIGVQKAGYVALGVSLIKLEKIKEIPAPHFEVVWCEETKSYWTEDMVFSAKLKAAGLDLWIDHSISHQIQHIGDYAYQFPRIGI